MEKSMRLDKFLADMGAGTRSQVKAMAKQGRIQVNGVTVKKPENRIVPGRDIVVCDNATVDYEEKGYYMLYKPQGVVSATEDNLHKTVIDLIRENPARGAEGKTARERGLFPVGRLDIDTEGLLLITNDGDLAHRLLSPRRHVDKRYFARVEGILPKDAKERFEEGIVLSDGTALMPGILEIKKGPWEEENNTAAEVILTIREGKFHQVKRMFEALGCRVTFLKRLSMGSLELDESLAPGEYRRLLEDELEKLRSYSSDRSARSPR